MDRRQLLRGAAALAAGRFLMASPTGQALAKPRLTSDPFALGVASGEPSTDGFVLWTRIAGIEQDVAPTVEIAEDDSFRRIVRTGRARAVTARGGAVHLEVAGLKPGRRYFYRFHLGDATSPVGRTKTIATRPDHLRLALTSCQHWEQGWFSGYADMIAQDVDAVLQVGDYIYEKSFGNGPDVRSFGAPVPRTLEDYRTRHALYRTDPHLAAAHAVLPFIVSWDDHEVENDYAGIYGVATQDPAAFIRVRAAAYQAYFEHMPLRPSVLRPGGEVRLYRRFGWGDLATVHVLDTRQYRSNHACSTPEQRGGRIVTNCAELNDPARTMMGNAQEQWFAKGLQRETARWSLITQQTLFSRLTLPTSSEAHYTDAWDGYGATRERVVSALTNPAVRNPVILGGDVHSFWVNDVKQDFSRPDGPTIATEFVTSCLASRPGPDALFGPAPSLNPHVRYLDNKNAGYTLIDVRPVRLEVDMRAVSDLTKQDSACFSLRRYTVEDGRPGAQA